MQYRNEAGTSWTFPAECLASVEYDPDEKTPIQCEVPAIVNPEKLTPHPALAFGVADRSERLQRIGENLYDIERPDKGYRGIPAQEATAPCRDERNSGQHAGNRAYEHLEKGFGPAANRHER